MADTTKLKALLSQLDSAKTDKSSLKSSKDTVIRRSNTVSALNEILKLLLDAKSVETVKALASSNNKSTQNQAKVLPTYNVRTPVIEIAINGVNIHPVDDAGASAAHFQDFSISFPMGGTDKTVIGSLKLFARNPGLILQALDHTYKQDDSSNLPTASIKWGWSFANSSDKQFVWSPTLKFLIMNVDMSNPDISGTEFTFQLQDIGDTTLKLSAANITLSPDYPQQQIRVIIEGMLQYRLFTLDDLLHLTGADSGGGQNESKTFFVNDRVGSLRTHGDNFFLVLEELAANCRCRCYTVQNSNLQTAISESNNSLNKYTELKSKLNQLSHTKASQEELTKAEKDVSEALADTALGCKLYWIDNVPADWTTTGQANFIKGSITTNEGAFFLLPDISNVDSPGSTADIIYGPGASSFPYLHGSAQNVFNSSIAAIGEKSQTFGDVLSMNVKHAPLIMLLKDSISEKAMYISDTEYMKSTDKGDVPTVKLSESYVKQYESKAAEYAKKGAEVTDQNLKLAYATRNKIRQSFRFCNAISKKNYMEVVDSVNVESQYKQRFNTAPGDEYAAMKLRSRVNYFLKYPTNVSITVLGDPNLIRLGIGAFEIISYYPNETGSKHNLNTLVSGVYTATKLTHHLSNTEYTTVLEGSRLYGNSDNTGVITKLIKITEKENDVDLSTGTVNNATATVSKGTETAALSVDLSDSTFTTGFLSKSLQELYKKHAKTN